MFFALSKLLTIFVTPSDLALLALVVAAIALERGRIRLCRNLLLGVAAFYLLFGIGPLGTWFARPLEDRFSPPPPELTSPDGIIELGGAIDPVISEARKTFAFSVSGARLTEVAILARRFPKARIVLAGGSGNLIADKIDEATTARRFLVALGIVPSRITLEKRSRTTYENALYCKAFVRPGEKWLLVTSALHMPRAVGVFRRQGYSIIPDPVGYLTTGRASDFWEFGDVLGSLERTDAAAHEWIGLIVYRLTGKTDAFLPGPR